MESVAKTSVKGTTFRAQILSGDRTWGALMGFKDQSIARFSLSVSCDITDRNVDSQAFPSHLKLSANLPYKGETHYIHVRMGKDAIKSMTLTPIYRQHIDAPEGDINWIPSALWKARSNQQARTQGGDKVDNGQAQAEPCDPRMNDLFHKLTTDEVDATQDEYVYQSPTQLYRLVVEMNREHLQAEGLFIDFEFESIPEYHVRRPLESLRELFLSQDAITLFVRSEEKDPLPDCIASLQTRFVEELAKADLFRCFYAEKFRQVGATMMPYLQLNDYPGVGQRPKLVLKPNRPVSRDILELTTRKGFAVVESFEYAKAKVAEFNDGIHYIKLFKMKGTGDLQYLAFFTPGEKLELRLKKDETISLQFDTSTQAIDSNCWTAKVLPPFAWSLSGDVCLAVFRPRQSCPKEWTDEKKAATIMPFVTWNVPCADMNELVPGMEDPEAALALICDKAPVLAVRATYKHSDTTTRRQIESIQALQRGERRLLDPITNAKGKQVHWAADAYIENLAKFLLFHTSIPHHRNDWLGIAKQNLVHLTDTDHRDVIDNGFCNAPAELLVLRGPAGTGKTEILAEAITAHALSFPAGRHLIGGPSNESADVVSVRIAEKFLAHQGLTGKIVLRMHHDTAEKQLVKGNAQQSHIEAVIARHPEMISFVVENRIMSRAEAEALDALTLEVIIDSWLEAQEAEAMTKADGFEPNVQTIVTPKQDPIMPPKDIFADTDEAKTSHESSAPESVKSLDATIDNAENEPPRNTSLQTPDDPLDPELPSDTPAQDVNQALDFILNRSNITPFAKFGELDIINVGTYDVNGNVIEDIKDLKEYVSELVTCAKITHDVQEYLKPSHAFVRDKRVKQYKLSLGYNALRTAGFGSRELFPANDFTEANKRKFGSFNTYLERIVKDGEGSLSSEDAMRFNESVKELFTFTIQNASVVIGTMTGLCNPMIVRNFQDLASIWTEEAGQVDVPSFLNTATRFTLAEGGQLGIVGCEKQLSPIVDGPTPLTGFMAENTQSILSLCLTAKWPSVTLVYNRRSAQSIIEIPSKLFYNGIVKAHPRSFEKGAHAWTVPLARWFCSEFPEFPKPSAVVYTETPTKAIKDEISDSWYNIGNSAFSLNLIERMVPELNVPVADIGYLSPYSAQCNSMKYGLLKLQIESAKAGKVIMYSQIKVGTTDSYQGGSAKVFIADFCLDDRIGFMTDLGRNCVLTTRGEDFTINIGHPPNDPPGKLRNWIKEMMDEAKLGNYHHALSAQHPWLSHRFANARVHMTPKNVENAGHGESSDDQSGHDAAATGGWGDAAATGGWGDAAATGSWGDAAATGGWGEPAATGNSGDATATGGWGNAAATGGWGEPAATGNSGDAAATGGWGEPAATGNSGDATATGSLGDKPSQLEQSGSFRFDLPPPVKPTKQVPNQKKSRSRKFRSDIEDSYDESAEESDAEESAHLEEGAHSSSLSLEDTQQLESASRPDIQSLHWITKPPEWKKKMSSSQKKKAIKRVKAELSQLLEQGLTAPTIWVVYKHNDQIVVEQPSKLPKVRAILSQPDKKSSVEDQESAITAHDDKDDSRSNEGDMAEVKPSDQDKVEKTSAAEDSWGQDSASASQW